MSETLTRVGTSLASGVENVIAFATSKRVLSILAAAVAAKYGGLPPELSTLGGTTLVAGFTITDALGKGKGARSRE